MQRIVENDAQGVADDTGETGGEETPADDTP